MNKREWQAKSAQKIKAAITEISKQCPPDWKIDHDERDWLKLEVAINDAYNVRDQRKLRRAMTAYTDASFESFKKWKEKAKGS